MCAGVGSFHEQGENMFFEPDVSGYGLIKQNLLLLPDTALVQGLTYLCQQSSPLFQF